MRRFWEQLTKSQKQIVIAGLVFVATALLVQFAAFPYFEARQKASGAIAGSEKALRELATLGAEYSVLRRRSEEIRRVIERRPPGFALFSYLEKRAGDAGVKTNIKSINPLKSAPAEAYEETAVEMRLDKLTMKQLTDFLYLVESREELVRIRKMSVVKMKESPEYLSVLLQVFTYQALPPGGSR
jgi:general secretion pathway protein M